MGKVVYPYLKNTDIFRCPSDSNRTERGINPNYAPNRNTIPASYRYNISNHPNGPWSALSLSALERPAEAILIAEATDGVGGLNWNQLATWENNEGYACIDYTNNVAYDRHAGSGTGRTQAGWRSATPENPARGTRDRAMANYVFADGHAKAMPWAQTWRPIGPVTKDTTGANVSPTMWRQNFSGSGDRCKIVEGQAR